MSKSKTITSVAQLCEWVDAECSDDAGTTVLYRGHGAASFSLVPKVGRSKPLATSTRKQVNEQLMLDLFRRQAPDRIGLATEDEWELLAIAQHHGMATRFLDWTRNPLAALYFSVCRECESRDRNGKPSCEDAELVVWRSAKVDLSADPPSCGPLKIRDTYRYVPRIVTPRLRAQNGLFTVHANPRKEFTPNDGSLMRLTIPYDKRRTLKKSLYRLGVHEATMFPDLDGLARHIEWLQTDSH